MREGRRGELGGHSKGCGGTTAESDTGRCVAVILSFGVRDLPSGLCLVPRLGAGGRVGVAACRSLLGSLALCLYAEEIHWFVSSAEGAR